MMLRYSFNMGPEADLVENAIKKVLSQGFRTGDIMQEGCKLVGTSQMGDVIIDAISGLS
jgi:3-isopropylmalate dehydrogenase